MAGLATAAGHVAIAALTVADWMCHLQSEVSTVAAQISSPVCVS